MRNTLERGKLVDLSVIQEEVQRAFENQSWRVKVGSEIVWLQGQKREKKYLYLFLEQKTSVRSKSKVQDLPAGIVFYRDKYVLGGITHTDLEQLHGLYPQINEGNCPQLFDFLRSFTSYC